MYKCLVYILYIVNLHCK